ncbi:virulence factor SrfB, partial [Salmonella enterica subsp. enterica serovar Anatum]|nr:virulence factor SrfB [Salmonella enterica subsp. enterica serovar Anatum]
DLILDVGNTHTCGVLIEDHGDANDGLRQTAELQVRSLSEPQYQTQLIGLGIYVLAESLIFAPLLTVAAYINPSSIGAAAITTL